MADWDDVVRLALALPAATEGTTYGHRSWQVSGRAFAWERPLRPADVAELGEVAPVGAVLALRVPDVGARQVLVADSPGVYFSTTHFAGFPAVLVRLAQIEVAELAEVLTEAWACRAPRRLVAQHLRG